MLRREGHQCRPALLRYSLSSLPNRVKLATNNTWDWTLRRGGKFFSTTHSIGQRHVVCGADAGSELKVRSARKCARWQDWSAEQILETYYAATLGQG